MFICMAGAFRGEHQAGIVTEAQDRMHFAAFDVTTDSKTDLVNPLMEWTHMAERMTRGEEAVPGRGGRPESLCAADGYRRGTGTAGIAADPDDRLRPSLFLRDGSDRFGIAGRRPNTLADLPKKFPNETMDPARSGGRHLHPGRANDLQVAVHAVRNLSRVGFGTAGHQVLATRLRPPRRPPATRPPRETCSGSRTEPTTSSPTKLQALDDHVWVVAADGPDWLTGGTTWCTRRIRMHRILGPGTTLLEQERVIGLFEGQRLRWASPTNSTN